MQHAAHRIERFKALALRHRLSLGVMASTAADDFALVVGKARADEAARRQARKAQWAESHQ